MRPCVRHIIVTVPDQAADPRDSGWPTTICWRECRASSGSTSSRPRTCWRPAITSASTSVPGIEEKESAAGAAPVLSVRRCLFVGCLRDREEELVDVARTAKRRTDSSLDRTAVVFQRPLPYLYLARQVFPDAEIPYQALDALPLAAEPFAAAIDLVFSFAIAEGTRATLVELMASPLWSFQIDGRPVERDDVAAADVRLREVKYVGGWDRWRRSQLIPRACVCRCGTPAARFEIDACVCGVACRIDGGR